LLTGISILCLGQGAVSKSPGGFVAPRNGSNASATGNIPEMHPVISLKWMQNSGKPGLFSTQDTHWKSHKGQGTRHR